MALTQLKTGAIADDAVTEDKLANAINTARTANTAKTTNATHTGDVTGSGSLTIADNAVTLAKMAGGTDGQIITYDASGDPVAVGPGTDGQVLTSTGAGSPPAFETLPASGRAYNLIINGDMQVAQRGTSSTSSGYKTVDRFAVYHSGTDEAATQAQADVASGTTPYTLGFRKALKITNGNQTSGAGAGDYIFARTILEAQDIASSGWNYTSSSSYITLSFWVKSSVAQNFYGYLRSLDGTEQGYPFETGSLTADTWTKITKTIPGASNVQFDINANGGLEVVVAPFWGTDYTGSVSLNAWSAFSSSVRTPDYGSSNDDWYLANDATLEITGVLLEVGNSASDYPHRSYAQELTLCHRYCNALLLYGTGDTSSNRIYNYDYAGGNGFVAHALPRMRLEPTITYSIYGGSIYADYSSNDRLQMFDSGDSNFYIYDVLCEAEL